MFTAPASAAIMITNVLGDYEYFAITSATTNGRIVAPVARNDLSALFVPPADAWGDVAWDITVSASNHDGIDVVSVQRAQRERATAPRPPPCAANPVGPSSF